MKKNLASSIFWFQNPYKSDIFVAAEHVHVLYCTDSVTAAKIMFEFASYYVTNNKTDWNS